MAFINRIFSNIAAGEAWYQIKEILKVAGWTVKSSGDGLALFSSTTDIITTGSSGAGGMNNTNAWYRIQMPLVDGVNREIVIQRGTSGPLGGVKYSFSAGFITGSPSATVSPTASDQAIASATTQSNWSGDNTFHLYLGAENSDGYQFWSAIIINGNASVNNSGGVVFERMLPGSGPVGDPDPYIFYTETTSSGSFNTAKLSIVNAPGTPSLGQAWIHKGLATETFAGVGAAGMGNVFASTPGAGSSIYDRKERTGPIVWGRTSASVSGPAYIKGVGSMMRWNGSPKASGQLYSVNSVNDRITISDICFPWDGVTRVVV